MYETDQSRPREVLQEYDITLAVGYLVAWCLLDAVAYFHQGAYSLPSWNASHALSLAFLVGCGLRFWPLVFLSSFLNGYFLWFEYQLVPVSVLAISMAILCGGTAWLWLHIKVYLRGHHVSQSLLFMACTCFLSFILNSVASFFLYSKGLLEAEEISNWITAIAVRDTLDLWLSYPFFASCLLPLVQQFFTKASHGLRPENSIVLPRPVGTGVLLALSLLPVVAWTLGHPQFLQGQGLYFCSLPLLALTVLYGLPGAAAGVYSLYAAIYPGTADIRLFELGHEHIFLLSTVVAAFGLALVLEKNRKAIHQKLYDEARQREDLRKSLFCVEKKKQEMQSQYQSLERIMKRCSQEMRSPLTPIFIWTQMLSESSSRKTLVEASRTIQQNIERQTRLLDELNDTLRLCTGKIKNKRELIEITDLLQQVLDQLRPLLNKREVDIQLRSNTTPDYVIGDREYLCLALHKIVDHLVRFGRKNSSISIHFSRQHRELLLHIKHAGYSYEQSDARQILQTEVSTDEDGFLTVANFDLGLYVAKKMIELQGGFLTASPLQPKSGMLFSLTLRKAPAKSVLFPSTPAGENQTVRSGLEIPLTILSSVWHKRHLLIVEDEPFTLQLLCQLLRSEGIPTIGCSTSATALEAFHRWQPPIVISDLELPDINGFELIKMMKKSAKRDFSAIAFSACVSPDAQSKALQAGFSAFLAKPLQAQDLRQVLDQLLGQQLPGQQLPGQQLPGQQLPGRQLIGQQFQPA